MFIALARPRIPLVGVADPVIEAMVNLMPDYSVGRRLHALYVNKTEAALPGNYSQMFGTGPAFRGIFFPSWQPDPLLPLVSRTGLDDPWWSGFAVAVLCQAIADMGSDIRGQMLGDTINGAVASGNARLRAQSSRAYAGVLEAAYGPFVTLLQQVDRGTAMRRFHDALLNNVINRQLWYQAGVWTSPDWEMFNQYAKYIALGAADADVDTLVDELAAAGLPIPDSVGRSRWRSYAEELRDKPGVDLEDIRSACADPIRATTTHAVGRGVSQMPNGNCYEFTANSQPGSGYRRVPSSSCFTGDTRVLDGSGHGVRLRELEPGATVLTRDGCAAVAYVARPLRGDRPLYRLAGGGPVFTATHPFCNGAPAHPLDTPPALLAVEPLVLAGDVPTLGEDGVGHLEAGSLLLGRGPGPGRTPAAVAVTGVARCPPTADDTHLYDVHLVTRSGERQEFWAGDGERFFLVAPEFPVLDRAGASATAVVALWEGLLGSGGPDRSGWPADLVETVNRTGPGVFHHALMQALATTPAFGAPPPPAPLHTRVDRLYSALDGVTTEMSAVVASLFDGLLATVGQWLASVVALGWRNCLFLDGEVLAVTVFDVALTPANPLPAGATVRLTVTATGGDSAQSALLWDRRGRDNTRFHHYFDQLLHLDLTGAAPRVDLSFALAVAGAAGPALFAQAPGVVGGGEHALLSAPLRDTAGAVVGTIRFDTRRLGRDAAARELADSGLWTEDAAEAYANALGAAMVEPVLAGLRKPSAVHGWGD